MILNEIKSSPLLKLKYPQAFFPSFLATFAETEEADKLFGGKKVENLQQNSKAVVEITLQTFDNSHNKIWPKTLIHLNQE